MTDFLPAGMNTSDRSDTESTGADAKERTTLRRCRACPKIIGRSYRHTCFRYSGSVIN